MVSGDQLSGPMHDGYYLDSRGNRVSPEAAHEGRATLRCLWLQELWREERAPEPPYQLFTDYPEGCSYCPRATMWEHRTLPYSGRQQSRCTGCGDTVITGPSANQLYHASPAAYPLGRPSYMRVR